MADVRYFLWDRDVIVQFAFSQELSEGCEDGELELCLDDVVGIFVLRETVAQAIVGESSEAGGSSVRSETVVGRIVIRKIERPVA